MHNLTASATNYDPLISVPDDGVDDETAASLYPAIQRVADNVAYVKARMDAALADLAALRAIDTTSLTNGEARLVKGQGWYTFDSGSAATEIEPWIIDPTTGPGRWISATAHQITRTIMISPASSPFYTPQAGGGLMAQANSFAGIVANAAIFVDYANIYFSDVATANANKRGVKLCLDPWLVHGCTITQLRAWVVGAGGGAGHAGLPASMPAIGLYRAGLLTETIDALKSTGGGLQSDTSASVAAYEALHWITLTPDQNNVVDRNNHSYWTSLWNEGHTNALAGYRVQGLELTITTIPDARRA